MDGADYALSVNNFDNVRNCHADLRKQFEERSTNICIAEDSEFGWQTVNEYMSRGTEINEDRDRRVLRAENAIRASRKQKAETTVSKGRG